MASDQTAPGNSNFSFGGIYANFVVDDAVIVDDNSPIVNKPEVIMQITVDPANLSQAQREAVAHFLITFPAAEKATGHDSAEIRREISLLAKEAEAFNASVPTPLTPAAASTAAAVPFAIAPEPAVAASPVPQPPAAAQAAVIPAPPVTIAAPPTASPAGAVDLDKRGFPWDARIHGSTKTKNADGTWRKKKNVEETEVTRVEAELRQLMGTPAPSAIPLPPTAGIAQPTTTTATPTVSIATPIVQATPPVPQADSFQMGYVALVGRASAAMGAGKISQPEINAICQEVGVPALPLIINRPDLLQFVATKIDALIASRQ